MSRDLWGQIVESEEEEILRIARGAVKKKDCATYLDFRKFIQQVVQKAEPSQKGRAEQRVEKVIRDTLKKHGWVKRTEERKKVVFYPPNSPLLKSDQMTLNIGNSNGNNSNRTIIHPPN